MQVTGWIGLYENLSVSVSGIFHKNQKGFIQNPWGVWTSSSYETGCMGYLYQNHQTSHLIDEILWQSGINCYAESTLFVLEYVLPIYSSTTKTQDQASPREQVECPGVGRCVCTWCHDARVPAEDEAPCRHLHSPICPVPASVVAHRDSLPPPAR